MAVLLDSKRLLVTGVLDPRSIAFHVARLAQEEGAEVVLTGFGKARRVTERTAQRLPDPPDVLELDVTEPVQIEAVSKELGSRWGVLDGLVHAVAYAPSSCLGGGFLQAPWQDVATALHVSTYSLAALSAGLSPLFRAGGGGAIVGLDFDATVAWPSYDWMGVAKAGLESCARYLARDLGPDRVSVNLVAAGPLHTMSARSIEGFEHFEEVWAARAPLGWDARDPEPVARAVCMLLSDWARGISGEVVHVDGGAHAIGASSRGYGRADAD
ncbi:MAG: enoyl-ACP reductase FabI [Actinomycetota bacterium]|nr:enoyl-ACP reductase FabI [Actinomycetota bacterium]